MNGYFWCFAKILKIDKFTTVYPQKPQTTHLKLIQIELSQHQSKYQLIIIHKLRLNDILQI